MNLVLCKTQFVFEHSLRQYPLHLFCFTQTPQFSNYNISLEEVMPHDSIKQTLLSCIENISVEHSPQHLNSNSSSTPSFNFNYSIEHSLQQKSIRVRSSSTPANHTVLLRRSTVLNTKDSLLQTPVASIPRAVSTLSTPSVPS